MAQIRESCRSALAGRDCCTSLASADVKDHKNIYSLHRVHLYGIQILNSETLGG